MLVYSDPTSAEQTLIEQQSLIICNPFYKPFKPSRIIRSGHYNRIGKLNYLTIYVISKYDGRTLVASEKFREVFLSLTEQICCDHFRKPEHVQERNKVLLDNKRWSLRYHCYMPSEITAKLANSLR